MAKDRAGSVSPRTLAAAIVLAAAVCWPQPARAADVSAKLSASPALHKGTCPATITFAGRVMSRKATRVQYRFVRSDGANAPVQTIEFDRPGSQSVKTTWTLGGGGLTSFTGWQAIEILYPSASTSNRAEFRIRCATAAPAPEPRPATSLSGSSLAAAAARLQRPDLTVTVSAPRLAAAGTPLRRAILVEAKNLGRAPAIGTLSDPEAGYLIDVVLSSDRHVPPGAKTYSDTYGEDVLLRGGRVSRTVDLASGASHRFTEIDSAEIPKDTPPGRYFICALVDSTERVAEADEENNVHCQSIRVRR